MANKIEEVLEPVVGAFMDVLVAQIPEDKLQDVADELLDKIEDLVDGTGTKLDDAIVEPVIAKVRATFGIEDGED